MSLPKIIARISIRGETADLTESLEWRSTAEWLTDFLEAFHRVDCLHRPDAPGHANAIVCEAAEALGGIVEIHPPKPAEPSEPDAVH